FFSTLNIAYFLFDKAVAKSIEVKASCFHLLSHSSSQICPELMQQRPLHQTKGHIIYRHKLGNLPVRCVTEQKRGDDLGVRTAPNICKALLPPQFDHLQRL